MLVCNDYNDYKIAHTLRAHGWDRGLSKKILNLILLILDLI